MLIHNLLGKATDSWRLLMSIEQSKMTLNIGVEKGLLLKSDKTSITLRASFVITSSSKAAAARYTNFSKSCQEDHQNLRLDDFVPSTGKPRLLSQVQNMHVLVACQYRLLHVS
jgi:hypothetical protein